MPRIYRFSLLLLGSISTVAIVTLLTSCNYNVLKTAPVAADFAAKSKRPDFAFVYSFVLERRCVECHSNGSGNEGKVNLETYSAVKKHLADVKSDIEDGSMPKDRPALTEEEKRVILNWIANGAPEFVVETPGADPTPNEPPTGGTNPVDLGNLDFKTVYKEVIEPACVKCHSSPENEGDVNLETYREVFKHRRDIEKDVRDGSMPKRKALTLIQREMILRWLVAGAREEAVVTPPPPPPVKEADPTDPSDPGYSRRTPDELAQIKRGQYIYRAGLCANCHTVDPTRPQAGGLEIKSPFGTFYTPNISRDRATGIGKWTKAEFLRAFREGSSPDYSPYYPSFPYQNYSKLSDEDIYDLRAYVLALPAISQRNRSHDLKAPYNIRGALIFWKNLKFPEYYELTSENFRLARGPMPTFRDKDKRWNRGAYLVEGAFHCTQCHTSRDSLGGLKLEEWMSGAALLGEKRPATNLTPDRATGLGDWTEADWLKFLQTATKPDGLNVGGEMRKIVLGGTALLTLDDQIAVAEYLRSLAPVRNYQFRHPVQKETKTKP